MPADVYFPAFFNASSAIELRCDATLINNTVTFTLDEGNARVLRAMAREGFLEAIRIFPIARPILPVLSEEAWKKIRLGEELKFTWVPGEEDDPLQFFCTFCGADDILYPGKHALQKHGQTRYKVNPSSIVHHKPERNPMPVHMPVFTNTETPSDKARRIVVEYFNKRKEVTDDFELTFDDAYVVWFCYILGGWKALIGTSVPDGMYYEITHSKEKNETYLDAYKKFENVVIEEG